MYNIVQGKWRTHLTVSKEANDYIVQYLCDMYGNAMYKSGSGRCREPRIKRTVAWSALTFAGYRRRSWS